jgi:transposase
MLNVEIFNMSNIDTSYIDFDKSYMNYDSNTNNLIIEIYLKKDDKVFCDKCGTDSVVVYSSKISPTKTSTFQAKNVIANVHRRKYKCQSCGHTFLQVNPLRTDGHRVSIQKEIMILNALRDKTKTYSAVAKEFDVSTTYVTNLFDTKVDIPRLKLPEVICIDEVYLKKLVNKSYCFIIYSPQWRKIIDVLDSRHKLDLIDYFSRISQEERDNVKYISMDLYEHYRAVIKKCFPKAKISADPFHVVKQLTMCFQNIRINTMKKYEFLKNEGSNYYWLYKKFWRFLLKDTSKLPQGHIKVSKSGSYMTKYQIIDNMLKLNPTLKLAYELKEEYRNFVATATIDTARDELLELIKKFKDAHINEYSSFINIMQKWFEEIINSFNKINGHKITNGPMERANRDIKTLNGISFGATNFSRMRNRIMFTMNENTPISPYRKGNTNKREGKPRGKYKKKNNK